MHEDRPDHRRAPGASEPIDRFARLALDCVHREYPNRLGHLLRSDADARPPRELTPAFCGCFDWHSAVHGHWLLAVTARRRPGTALADEAVRSLHVRLTREHVEAEVRYLAERPGFERPYGLAWLAALHAELRCGQVAELDGLGERLAPLVDVAVAHVASWLPKLSAPSRSGVHSQTAFALGLFVDWARGVGREHERALFEARSRDFFGADRDYAVHLEPGGEDFLSPSLGAADLMSRVLSASELAGWLDRAVPALGRDHAAWLRPARVSDPSDGRLAHLDGLNLSRAWMLRRVANALDPHDPRVASLRGAARAHADAGWAAVSDAHYEGSHWLGTFATYLALVPPDRASSPDRDASS